MEKNYSNLRVWVEITPMSERLKNSLRFYDSIKVVNDPFDITEEKFCEIKGVGKKRWNELQRVRKYYPFRIKKREPKQKQFELV